MEKLLTELIESAKKNRKGLLKLKNTAITCRQFELAEKLRELEKEFFPQTEELIEIKKEANRIRLAFALVGLHVDNEDCWLIAETLKKYKEKKGMFSIKDAVELKLKKEEIFLH